MSCLQDQEQLCIYRKFLTFSFDTVLAAARVASELTKFIPKRLPSLVPARWKPIIYFIRYEFVAVLLGIFSLVEDIVYKHNNVLNNPQKRTKQIAIVTGGGRGMGLHIVKGLMKSGMSVVIGVRRPEECQKLLESMKIEFPEGNVSAIRLDTSSLASVRQFSEDFLSTHKELHVLVNNAGIFHGRHRLTEDGFESQLATNYIGHALLTHLMMDSMKAGAKDCELYSRIIHVTSCAHIGAPIFFDDINLKKFYNKSAGYSQSKLAQLMFSRSLDRIFEENHTPIRSYAVHPGIVSTEMMTVRCRDTEMTKHCKTPADGALTVLYACLSPELEKKGGGRYISNCIEGYSTPYSKSHAIQDRLYKYTIDLLNIKNI